MGVPISLTALHAIMGERAARKGAWDARGDSSCSMIRESRVVRWKCTSDTLCTHTYKQTDRQPSDAFKILLSEPRSGIEMERGVKS